MSVRLYGCVCGVLRAPNGAMSRGAAGVGRFPLPFYLIEHPKARLLFDCGLHQDLLDPEDPVRQALGAQGLELELGPEDSLAAGLEALEVDPASIDLVVLSHLHFDHVGGLHQLPNAQVAVQRREWETGMDPDGAARNFLHRPYFDLGHKVTLIEGDHDLFGDGTVTCLASYGHTPGHQSLRVRADGGDFILTADACYFCSVRESRAFPPFGDAEAMTAALDRLLSLGDPETTYVFGHDPAQWGEDPAVKTRRAGAVP